MPEILSFLDALSAPNVIVPIISALIGALVPDIRRLVVYIVTRLKKGRVDTVARSPRRWEIGSRLVFCVVGLIVGIVLGMTLFHQKAKDMPPEIHITSHAEGTIVEPREIVRGTSFNISEDHEIWVVLYNHAVNRYYPQNKYATRLVDGEWSSVCYFGAPEDSNIRFEIYTILADRAMQDYFAAYISRAENKNDYPGIGELPAGIMPHDRVSVILQ